MSSSSKQNELIEINGTVFMGPNTNRESPLDILLDTQYRDKFSQKTEEDYIAKIEAKAQEKVRKMLEIAQSSVRKMQEEMQNSLKDKQVSAQKLYDDAEKVKKEAAKLKKEAEELYASAKQKAYDDAIASARGELEGVRSDIGNSTAFVMQVLANQFPNLVEAWKKELVLLLQDSVEVAIAYSLSSEKKAILESFFAEALNQLEDKKRIHIQSNQQDEALVTDILLDAKKTKFPEIESYKVQVNPNLEQGSIVISSDFGHIENDYTARRMQLRDILKHLSLPFGQIDQDMQNEVNSEVQKRLINLEQSLSSPLATVKANSVQSSETLIEAQIEKTIEPVVETLEKTIEPVIEPLAEAKIENLSAPTPATVPIIPAQASQVLETTDTLAVELADELVIPKTETVISNIDELVNKLDNSELEPIEPIDPFEAIANKANAGTVENSLVDELLEEASIASPIMDQNDIDNLLK